MDNKKAMTTNVTFFPTKKLMVEDAEQKGHTFFVSKDYDSKTGKEKKFASFIDINDFLTFENTIAVENKHHYEMLIGEVAEYYDIDYKVNHKNRTIEDVVTDFIDARTDFQEIYFPDIPLEREHFCVKKTDDPEGNKLSSHIIIRNGKKFANTKELKQFTKKFQDYIEKSSCYKEKVDFDPVPYGKDQNFRILGHSKFGQPDRRSYRCPEISEFNDTCDTKLFYASYLEGTESFYPKFPTKSEEKKEKEIIQEEYDENNVDIEELRNWVDIISDSRMDTRDTWLLLCWCLRGLTNKSQEGLELFKYKSSMSPSGKHDEEGCEREWYRDNGREDTLKLESLIHWAKEDNYEAYQNLVKICKSTQNNIHHCLNGSHCDLAKLFMRLYGDANIKIRSDETISYFGWNEETKLWEECSKHRLLNLISDVLVPYFLTLQKDFYAQIQALGKNDKDKEGLLSAKFKQICKMVCNLKTIPYLKNISLAIAGKEFDKEFESKVINKAIYLLPIKGGKIIDLKTLTVKDRTRNDYFSVELNVNYLSDVNFETHVLKFFKSITCNDPNLLDYHRRLWGYMMTGSIADRSLHIMWGNGCNGKSSIVNIFKAIMGTFAVSLDDDTMMKKNSGGAKPEMMDLLHSRCGFLPESDKKETINSKRVKTITGDDEISARHLYGSIIKFRTQCKPIFPTNHKPEIDIDDQAILDRLKLIPFLGRFTKNKTNSDYIKDLQETKLDEFFTWFCGGAFDWINGQELIPCESMNAEMDTYIKENNPIIDFVADTFDLISLEEYEKIPILEKKDWRCKTSDMYMEYGNWRQINDEKLLGKHEFHKLLRNRVAEKKDSKGTKCYLCRLKQEEKQEKVDGRPPM